MGLGVLRVTYIPLCQTGVDGVLGAGGGNNLGNSTTKNLESGDEMRKQPKILS